jgi:hypothetical protein
VELSRQLGRVPELRIVNGVFALVATLVLVTACTSVAVTSPNPTPTATASPATASAAAWPPEFEASLCGARALLGTAAIPSRASISKAFDLIDSAPEWAPGKPAITKLRETFEIYSDAELLQSAGQETAAILRAAEALEPLGDMSDAMEALTAATGFPLFCGTS